MCPATSGCRQTSLLCQGANIFVGVAKARWRCDLSGDPVFIMADIQVCLVQSLFKVFLFLCFSSLTGSFQEPGVIAVRIWVVRYVGWEFRTRETGSLGQCFDCGPPTPWPLPVGSRSVTWVSRQFSQVVGLFVKLNSHHETSYLAREDIALLWW